MTTKTLLTKVAILAGYRVLNDDYIYNIYTDTYYKYDSDYDVCYDENSDTLYQEDEILDTTTYFGETKTSYIHKMAMAYVAPFDKGHDYTETFYMKVADFLTKYAVRIEITGSIDVEDYVPDYVWKFAFGVYHELGYKTIKKVFFDDYNRLDEEDLYYSNLRYKAMLARRGYFVD